MNKKEILDRIKIFYNIHTNAGLARLLDVHPNVVTNWYSRDTIDYDIVFDKCIDINKNWLLTGEGEKTIFKHANSKLTREEFEQFEKLLLKIPDCVVIRKPEITALIEYNGRFYKANTVHDLEKYLDRIKHNLDFKKVEKERNQ